MGIHILDEPIKISTPTADAWTNFDVDTVIADLPPYVTGVVLRVQGPGTMYNFGISYPGATNRYYSTCYTDYEWGYFVGINELHQFAYYVDTTTAFDIYIVAYTTTDWVFFDTEYDVTPGTAGSYQTVDCSSYVPAGATGIIFLVYVTGTTGCRWAIRQVGASEDPYINSYRNSIGSGVYPCNSSRQVEAKIESTSAKIKAIGYVKAQCGITFQSPPYQSVSPTAGNTLEYFYVADPAIYKAVLVRGGGGSWLDIRTKGSDDFPDGRKHYNPQVLVPVDVSGYIETKRTDYSAPAHVFALVKDGTILSSGQHASVVGLW